LIPGRKGYEHPNWSTGKIGPRVRNSFLHRGRLAGRQFAPLLAVGKVDALLNDYKMLFFIRMNAHSHRISRISKYFDERVATFRVRGGGTDHETLARRDCPPLVLGAEKR
jgi:hypothetical protein